MRLLPPPISVEMAMQQTKGMQSIQYGQLKAGVDLSGSRDIDGMSEHSSFAPIIVCPVIIGSYPFTGKRVIAVAVRLI